MKPDLYTKVVLTVIAIMLIPIALRSIVTAMPVTYAAKTPTKISNGVVFLELGQNEWTNADSIQEIDALPNGSYAVTFKSGSGIQYTSDWGKSVLKDFLNQ
jgi:hypothetical protein